MATNYWQFGEFSEPNRQVHELNNVSWDKKFEQLTNIVSSLVVEKSRSFKAYGICTMTDHPTDYCPCLQVYGVGNFPGPPQMPYDPYGDTYNSGWQDHPNFSYAQNSWPNSTYQPYQPEKSSLELMVENLITSQGKIQDQIQNQIQDQMAQSQKRTDSRIQDMERQISLLAQTMSRIDSQLQGKLPSQTEPNPKENVSAITLRSATVIEPPVQTQKKEGIKCRFPRRSYTGTGGITICRTTSLPNVFRKGEVHIPLLEVIRKIPRYAHFLKDLYTNKRRLFGHEKVNLGENVFTILTRRLPPKFKDQDMFAITRKIHKISLKEQALSLPPTPLQPLPDPIPKT
ncbi:hypothetical protein GQ457_05G025010 [Hibiscus cannabinus]